MVEDSIMQKFNSSNVSVVGVDIWNSSDSLIGAYIAATGVSFPVAKKGASASSAYSVIANSMVVIDQNGVVQFVEQLGTSAVTYVAMRKMVSGAASKTRDLLKTSVNIPATNFRTGVSAGKPLHQYSLSGRRASDRPFSSNMLVTHVGGAVYIKRQLSER